MGDAGGDSGASAGLGREGVGGAVPGVGGAPAATDGAPAGVDAAAVAQWMAGVTADVRPPLRFERIIGGWSNLTFHMWDAAGHHWVLRRPPLRAVEQSAHDMAREHRIMSALADSAVPVPPTVGLCEDDTVIGAPFFVMEHVDGMVLRDRATVERTTDTATRTRAGAALVDTLVALHNVDPDAVGLGDLGRRENYCARQLRRWRGQWDKVATRELPEVAEAYDRLVADIPEQMTTAIVHGDYRLDNLIVDDRGDVAAVVDWELCTLGDPLADLGMLWVYWKDRDDQLSVLPQTVSDLPGFPAKRELVERYARASGRDLSEFPFYVALGYWRLAVILEGVYSRFSAGAYGDMPDRVRALEDVVPRLAHGALAAAEESGR